MQPILQAVQNAQQKTSKQTRPFILLTWAQSLDGMIASKPGTQTLISGPTSMQLTHALRAIHHAILVGIGTVLSDDPRLTSRIDHNTSLILSHISPHRFSIHPIPVVLDSHLRIPPTARLFQTERDAKPFIFTGSRDTKRCDKHEPLSELATVLKSDAREGESISHSANHLQSLLQQLFDIGIQSIMVEGGASVLSSFLDAGFYDMIITTVSPNLFGQGVQLSANSQAPSFGLTNIKNPMWTQLGDDVVVAGYP